MQDSNFKVVLEKPNEDSRFIMGALKHYDLSEKIHIMDLYNCYGVDAIIKYLH